MTTVANLHGIYLDDINNFRYLPAPASQQYLLLDRSQVDARRRPLEPQRQPYAVRTILGGENARLPVYDVFVRLHDYRALATLLDREKQFMVRLNQ